MDGLQTLLVSLACLAAPCPAAAGPTDAAELLRLFADCAGRYSAETEHSWLINPAAEGEAQLRRDQFTDLVATMVEAGQSQQVMAWRVEAKAAQRGLLMQADFAGNKNASRAALALRAACDRLLPTS